VKPRWAVALSEDYRYGGTPFRGVLVNMPFNVNGKITFRDNDQMMMGTGIYPPNMEKDERIKPLLLDLAKPYSMNPREPFDVYLRWPIRNIGVSHTELISDMWCTRNYQSTPQGIVCESVDHGDRVVRPRGGFVSTKALGRWLTSCWGVGRCLRTRKSSMCQSGSPVLSKTPECRSNAQPWRSILPRLVGTLLKPPPLPQNLPKTTLSGAKTKSRPRSSP
jgi:hypothetical protein